MLADEEVLMFADSLEKSESDLAVQRFIGKDTEQVDLRNYDSWYSQEVLIYLTHSLPIHPDVFRYVFVQDTEENKEQAYYKQFVALSILSEKLQKVIYFIATESPISQNHFIFGIICSKNILIINPIGITKHQDFDKYMETIKRYVSLDRIYQSNLVLQHDENGLFSCGPICIELMQHISILPLEEILRSFDNWKCSKINEVNIANLFKDSSMQNLVSSENYQSVMRELREKHLNYLRAYQGSFLGCNEQALIFDMPNIVLGATEPELFSYSVPDSLRLQEKYDKIFLKSKYLQAIKDGDITEVKILLSKDSLLLRILDLRGYTTLILSIVANSQEKAEYLLKAGVRTDAGLLLYDNAKDFAKRTNKPNLVSIIEEYEKEQLTPFTQSNFCVIDDAKLAQELQDKKLAEILQSNELVTAENLQHEKQIVTTTSTKAVNDTELKLSDDLFILQKDLLEKSPQQIQLELIAQLGKPVQANSDFYKLEKMPGDNACAFHALLYGTLDEAGLGKNGAILRKKAITQLLDGINNHPKVEQIRKLLGGEFKSLFIEESRYLNRIEDSIQQEAKQLLQQENQALNNYNETITTIEQKIPGFTFSISGAIDIESTYSYLYGRADVDPEDKGKMHQVFGILNQCKKNTEDFFKQNCQIFINQCVADNEYWLGAKQGSEGVLGALAIINYIGFRIYEQECLHDPTIGGLLNTLEITCNFTDGVPPGRIKELFLHISIITSIPRVVVISRHTDGTVNEVQDGESELIKTRGFHFDVLHKTIAPESLPQLKILKAGNKIDVARHISLRQTFNQNQATRDSKIIMEIIKIARMIKELLSTKCDQKENIESLILLFKKLSWRANEVSNQLKYRDEYAKSIIKEKDWIILEKFIHILVSKDIQQNILKMDWKLLEHDIDIILNWVIAINARSVLQESNLCKRLFNIINLYNHHEYSIRLMRDEKITDQINAIKQGKEIVIFKTSYGCFRVTYRSGDDEAKELLLSPVNNYDYKLIGNLDTLNFNNDVIDKISYERIYNLIYCTIIMENIVAYIEKNKLLSFAVDKSILIIEKLNIILDKIKKGTTINIRNLVINYLDAIYVGETVRYIKLIEETFDVNEKEDRLALLRVIEVIGEASKNISDNSKGLVHCANIPWIKTNADVYVIDVISKVVHFLNDPDSILVLGCSNQDDQLRQLRDFIQHPDQNPARMRIYFDIISGGNNQLLQQIYLEVVGLKKVFESLLVNTREILPVYTLPSVIKLNSAIYDADADASVQKESLLKNKGQSEKYCKDVLQFLDFKKQDNVVTEKTHGFLSFEDISKRLDFFKLNITLEQYKNIIDNKLSYIEKITIIKDCEEIKNNYIINVLSTFLQKKSDILKFPDENEFNLMISSCNLLSKLKIWNVNYNFLVEYNALKRQKKSPTFSKVQLNKIDELSDTLLTEENQFINKLLRELPYRKAAIKHEKYSQDILQFLVFKRQDSLAIERTSGFLSFEDACERFKHFSLDITLQQYEDIIYSQLNYVAKIKIIEGCEVIKNNFIIAVLVTFIQENSKIISFPNESEFEFIISSLNILPDQKKIELRSKYGFLNELDNFKKLPNKLALSKSQKDQIGEIYKILHLTTKLIVAKHIRAVTNEEKEEVKKACWLFVDSIRTEYSIRVDKNDFIKTVQYFGVNKEDVFLWEEFYEHMEKISIELRRQIIINEFISDIQIKAIEEKLQEAINNGYNTEEKLIEYVKQHVLTKVKFNKLKSIFKFETNKESKQIASVVLLKENVEKQKDEIYNMLNVKVILPKTLQYILEQYSLFVNDYNKCTELHFDVVKKHKLLLTIPEYSFDYVEKFLNGQDDETLRSFDNIIFALKKLGVCKYKELKVWLDHYRKLKEKPSIKDQINNLISEINELTTFYIKYQESDFKSLTKQMAILELYIESIYRAADSLLEQPEFKANIIDTVTHQDLLRLKSLRNLIAHKFYSVQYPELILNAYNIIAYNRVDLLKRLHAIKMTNYDIDVQYTYNEIKNSDDLQEKLYKHATEIFNCCMKYGGIYNNFKLIDRIVGIDLGIQCDIDFLIEFNKDTPVVNKINLQLELCNLLQVAVNVKTYEELTQSIGYVIDQKDYDIILGSSVCFHKFLCSMEYKKRFSHDANSLFFFEKETLPRKATNIDEAAIAIGLGPFFIPDDNQGDILQYRDKLEQTLLNKQFYIFLLAMVSCYEKRILQDVKELPISFLQFYLLSKEEQEKMIANMTLEQKGTITHPIVNAEFIECYKMQEWLRIDFFIKQYFINLFFVSNDFSDYVNQKYSHSCDEIDKNQLSFLNTWMLTNTGNMLCNFISNVLCGDSNGLAAIGFDRCKLVYKRVSFRSGGVNCEEFDMTCEEFDMTNDYKAILQKYYQDYLSSININLVFYIKGKLEKNWEKYLVNNIREGNSSNNDIRSSYVEMFSFIMNIINEIASCKAEIEKNKLNIGNNKKYMVHNIENKSLYEGEIERLLQEIKRIEEKINLVLRHEKTISNINIIVTMFLSEPAQLNLIIKSFDALASKSHESLAFVISFFKKKMKALFLKNIMEFSEFYIKYNLLKFADRPYIKTYVGGLINNGKTLIVPVKLDQQDNINTDIKLSDKGITATFDVLKQNSTFREVQSEEQIRANPAAAPKPVFRPA